MSLGSDFIRLIPIGATHAIVEERMHRGEPVYAVTAVIPNGAAIPINAYSTLSLAESTAELVNQHLAA